MNYTIGIFAEKTGLSRDTLRYYEKEGLLQPERRSNQRLYSEQDLLWIDFIKRLKETGMSVKQIAHYAILRTQGTSTIEARINLLLAHKDYMLAEQHKIEENIRLLDEKIHIYKKQLKS